MLPSFLLSLREGLEIALIIGIVLGALVKIGRPDLKGVVWAGTFSAIFASLACALFLTAVGASLEGQAEEIFEGFTMFLAAGVLTWMIFWMNAQSRNLRQEIESGVRQATLTGGKRGLFLLAFIAVLREGIELALFLSAAAFVTDDRLTVAGLFLGLLLAAFLGWSFFASTNRLNLRRFFGVTSFFLLLFAAGLVAHGVHEFNEVGWIPAVIEDVWNINSVIDEQSFFGQLLTALFGYNGNPSLTEAIAYFFYFGIILFTIWKISNFPPSSQLVRDQKSIS